MTLIKNYYELLGVERSADAATLRRAFHKRSKAFHPDTTSLPKAEAAEKFQMLCEAYDLLIDLNKRKLYDDQLALNGLGKALSGNGSTKSECISDKSVRRKSALRPLSGGELFSLFLLLLTIILSLVLCLVVAYIKGADLQFQPSWLVANQL